MTSMQAAYWLGGAWVFMLGAVVGSFANVCIYRIPWEKSVIWPGSHCPRCMTPLAARDNIPIFGWIFLMGRCRICSSKIAIRYPLIELLGGLLFLAVFYADLISNGRFETNDFLRAGYHWLLVSLLIVATFIDYDYQLLPDSVTVTGMILGLGLGTLLPGIRPAPGTAATMWEGLKFGGIGLFVGGGVIWAIRIVFGFILRKEAMGFGDVTLMAMIGSFLGWQAILPVLFLGALIGLVHAVVRTVDKVAKWITRSKSRPNWHEIPFGPYLSMASVILMLGWPWIWGRVLANFYRSLVEAYWFFTGQGF